jgi:predicted component of type VI protein secretion system
MTGYVIFGIGCFIGAALCLVILILVRFKKRSSLQSFYKEQRKALDMDREEFIKRLNEIKFTSNFDATNAHTPGK